jgi:hypothetical protein
MKKIDLQFHVDIIRIDAINTAQLTLAEDHTLSIKGGVVAVLDDTITPSNLTEIPFHRTATITSAACATPVNILATADVPTGKKVYLQGFIAKVDGATAWGTTATVKIQDNNGTPVDFVTMAVSALTGNTVVTTGTANITAEDAFSEGTGGTATKGLQLKGNANGTGSDLKVTVWGVIK